MGEWASTVYADERSNGLDLVCKLRTMSLEITNVTMTSLGMYGHCPHCSDVVSEALFFRRSCFCADLSGPVSPILHVCVRLS